MTNAQRRRAAKKKSLTVYRAGQALVAETRTLRLLRQRMQEFVTRQQFELMLLERPAQDRPALRKLLEPMLRMGLPCCGQERLRQAMEKRNEKVQDFSHGAACPSRNTVTLT